MLNESILKNEEKAVYELRKAYRQFGYLPYKMGKFEEYDFYVKNKDFLISDSIITFNATNGKLMALKPDVTLSIIKNYKDEPGTVQRVYYDENVYRISESTNDYKEIMQTGLECFGEITMQNKLEVIYLAAKSLSAISDDFVLEVSHLGILSSVLDAIVGDIDDREELKSALVTCIGEKNAHEISYICDSYGVSKDMTKRLQDFVSVYGDREKTIQRLEELFSDIKTESFNKAMVELKELSKAIGKSQFKDKVIFDFSIVDSMKYYNGVIFRGFISGIPESVLSGGQYDNLMKSVGKNGGAIGFAVYLDLLENLNKSKNLYDVDVVLLYDENDSFDRLLEEVAKLSEYGKNVSLQKQIPENLSYKTLMKMTEKGAEIVG